MRRGIDPSHADVAPSVGDDDRSHDGATDSTDGTHGDLLDPPGADERQIASTREAEAARASGDDQDGDRRRG